MADLFPFKRFFDDTPAPLFSRQNFETDLQAAQGCYRYISQIFAELRVKKKKNFFIQLY